MVAFSSAAVAGLMMVNARISNPILTPEVFNKWYSDIHVRDMVSNKFATIALRYSNYTVGSGGATSAFTLASNYLALYNTPDVNFVGVPGNMDKLPLNHETLPTKTQPVTTWSSWVFTYWLPQQIFDGNSTATARPKYALVVKIEPAKGGEDDLDQWYRKEHLGLLSALPGYRRSTRYKSSDGSRPRFLAIHEVDDLDTFLAAAQPALTTEWAKKVKSAAATFDTSTWQLFLERGNTGEKLGKQ